MAVCCKCKAKLEDGSAFCDSCGAKQVQNLVCEKCGAKLESGAGFCDECGAKQNSAAAMPKPNPAKVSGMKKLSGGTFMMGSPANERGRNSDREKQHRVTLSSFYIGIYPVTQKEYQEIMGNNPSAIKGDNLPVESVSWFDAVNYCNKRSEKEGLKPAYTINGENVTWNRNANGYRLPTDAEWEYACRAGTTTAFYTGNNITTDQANYNGKYPYLNYPKGVYRDTTTPVGSFPPNPWGLYDMIGNTDDRCWDWFREDPGTEQNDPAGPTSGEDNERLIRGGCYNTMASNCRCAYRGMGGKPSSTNNFIGFRLARNEK